MKSLYILSFCFAFFLSVTGLASDCKMHFASVETSKIEGANQTPCHDHSDDSSEKNDSNSEKSCDHCLTHCAGSMLTLHTVHIDLENPFKMKYQILSIAYKSVLPNPPEQPPRS